MEALIDISERLLVKLAGQSAYERGVSYFADGRVTAVLALVASVPYMPLAEFLAAHEGILVATPT